MDIALKHKLESDLPDPPVGKPSRSKFTLRQAIIVGFMLGTLYAVVAGVVAYQMAADGACLSSQYR